MVLFSRGVDGLGQVLADLLVIDVEGCDELHVAHVVRPELHVHEAGHRRSRVGVAVVLHALHQRAGTVADADDGDAHRSHQGSPCVFGYLGRGSVPRACWW
jgi:hypothetical protein